MIDPSVSVAVLLGEAVNAALRIHEGVTVARSARSQADRVAVDAQQHDPVALQLDDSRDGGLKGEVPRCRVLELGRDRRNGTGDLLRTEFDQVDPVADP